MGGSQGVGLSTPNIVYLLQNYYFATPENAIFMAYS